MFFFRSPAPKRLRQSGATIQAAKVQPIETIAPVTISETEIVSLNKKVDDHPLNVAVAMSTSSQQDVEQTIFVPGTVLKFDGPDEEDESEYNNLDMGIMEEADESNLEITNVESMGEFWH